MCCSMASRCRCARLSACQMHLIVSCIHTIILLHTDCITSDNLLCSIETYRSKLDMRDNREGMAKILRAQVIGAPKRLIVTHKRPEPNTQLQLMSCLQSEAAHRFDLEHDSALVGCLKCVKCLLTGVSPHLTCAKAQSSVLHDCCAGAVLSFQVLRAGVCSPV